MVMSWHLNVIYLSSLSLFFFYRYWRKWARLLIAYFSGLKCQTVTNSHARSLLVFVRDITTYHLITGCRTKEFKSHTTAFLYLHVSPPGVAATTCNKWFLWASLIHLFWTASSFCIGWVLSSDVKEALGRTKRVWIVCGEERRDKEGEVERSRLPLEKE